MAASVKYTVLNVAYPLAPTGIDAVGGAEQVLSMLDRALVRAGHRSVVVACEGSTAAGDLIETRLTQGAFVESKRGSVHAEHRANIERALAHYDVDVIHLHGIDFAAYLPSGNVPALVTLHLPPSLYAPEVFQLDRPLTFLQCVSGAQQQSCPPCVHLMPYIENGVDFDGLQTRVRKREFVLALGRICPEKGFHLALDAARRSRVALVLAGEVYPYEAHRQYFHAEIVPRLDRLRRFVGPIGFGRKRRLLSAARCLLVPSLAAETSSLVAMEALGCGTPVVAFPAGALPEIVDHGRTGFIVNSVAEMADAIDEVSELDGEACRRVARERFSSDRAVRDYFAVYERLAACKRTVQKSRAD